MIPKRIHYCWLGDDPYPEKIQYCIDSWKKILPDYELILWDRQRFDIDSVPWVREAFDAKKYAFAADYIRCYALYTMGGIYLDSDVEVLRRYDDLLDKPYFLGYEWGGERIEAATMGAEAGHPLYADMLRYYEGRHFATEQGLDTLPMPRIMQQVIAQGDYKLDIKSSDYFSPKHDEQVFLTENTYSIHHYTASWRGKTYNQLRLWAIRLLGVRGKKMIGNILQKLGKKY